MNPSATTQKVRVSGKTGIPVSLHPSTMKWANFSCSKSDLKTIFYSSWERTLYTLVSYTNVALPIRRWAITDASTDELLTKTRDLVVEAKCSENTNFLFCCRGLMWLCFLRRVTREPLRVSDLTISSWPLRTYNLTGKQT